MAKKKIDKKNNELTGIIVGIVVPVIAIIFYYLFENPTSFILFVKQIFMGSTYTRIFGVCIVPDFVVFFIFRYQKRFKAAEGVSIATLLYLLFIVVLKYI